MNKKGVIITSIVCGSLMLLGCTTPTQPTNIAKSLDMNLNNLTTTIKKLDTIDNSYLSNPDIYPITNVNNIKSVNNQNISTLKISTNDFNLYVPQIKSRKKIATENNVVNEKEESNESNNEINNDEESIDKETLNQNETVYFYSIKPIKYLPRYYSDFSYDKNVDYLSNYINKVRNLYAITSDAILANNQLNNFKNNIIVYCLEIKELNNSIKDGSFVPTSQQVAALNNYIDDIKITIKRIKKCNGDLSDEVSSINKTDVGGITTGIDVINSNYLTVLNHLDTRITYLKNALTTLEQIKQLLQESQNIVESNPEISEQVLEKEIIIEQPELNKNNTVENTTEQEKNAVIDNNTINNDSLINENNLTEKEMVDNIVENKNETIIDATNFDVDDNETTNKNIDSYLNTNNNLDTYKPEINETVNNNVDETAIVTPQAPAVDSTNNNTIVNNNGLNNTIVDNEKINAPNGTFQNGIITQNNLNNGVNNGVNGNNTGYTSSAQYINNSNFKNTNKNIDTYGYNTMIDMINNGTVNNGINTLNVSEGVKPSMVSSDNINCEDCLNENSCFTDENCLNNDENAEILNESESNENCENECENLKIEQLSTTETDKITDNYEAELL